MADLIGRGEKGGVVQARESIPLLACRFKLTENVSPQEPLAEWARNIYVLFNTIMVLKLFLPRQSSFSPVECDLFLGITPRERDCGDGSCGSGMGGNGRGGRKNEGNRGSGGDLGISTVDTSII